jgi:hypothetical protein
MLTGKTISELPLLSTPNPNMVAPVELSGVTYHINYSQILTKPNASYTSTSNQPLLGSNTPTIVLVDTIESQIGFDLVDNSKFTALVDGTYLFGVSFQLDKATLSPANATAYFWTRVDGVNVERSAGEIVLLNNNNEQLPFIPYSYVLNAGQYVEFVFASSDDTVYLKYVGDVTSPYNRPSTPSVAITINTIS